LIYAKRIHEADTIKHFLTVPELWDRISESGQKAEEFEPTMIDCVHWVGLFEESKMFGIGLCHPINNTTCMVHINIKREYRQRLGKQGGKLFLEYIVKKTDFQKVNAEVPVIYKNVAKFTEKMGFKIEGLNKKSINKNNTLHDQIMFGQTRHMIEEFLNKGV